ncbi:sigma factor [Amycolatopsis sp. lyj-84]|uniref:sigma factor n=1 Tax=Amycolatopsis sp. lyj-84 TaxID=2789284 RepID=UPI00397E152D
MVTDTGNPALVQRAGQGDTATFAELYDRTSQDVFRLVHSILGDAGSAEDVAREVYPELWRTAPGYDPGDPITLMMTMACRYALEQVRNRRPRDNAPTPTSRAESRPREDVR